MLLTEAEELDPQAYAFEQLPAADPFHGMRVRITVKDPNGEVVKEIPLMKHDAIMMRGSHTVPGVTYPEGTADAPEGISDDMAWDTIVESAFAAMNEDQQRHAVYHGAPDDDFPPYAWIVLGGDLDRAFAKLYEPE